MASKSLFIAAVFLLALALTPAFASSDEESLSPNVFSNHPAKDSFTSKAAAAGKEIKSAAARLTRILLAAPSASNQTQIAFTKGTQQPIKATPTRANPVPIPSVPSPSPITKPLRPSTGKPTFTQAIKATASPSPSARIKTSSSSTISTVESTKIATISPPPPSQGLRGKKSLGQMMKDSSED